MLSTLVASTAGAGFHVGLLATAYGFGFRHGIDWDHLAALTDITSSQDAPRRSMVLATLYALGHGVVVFVLGLQEGQLPRRAQSSPFLDEERRADRKSVV